ncbi:hypothetical protein [Microbacterium sp. EST19A]|uniref:hypothetical protein n=1 Tax=Microbacterium sp. EST19A TaxID=2862681 RepID=UPI001CBDE626|nr:hypothetical protein [Microbacterium sp. EST19A]
MSDPTSDPTPSLVRQRRALRRSTIVWSVVLVLQVIGAVGFWGALIFDGNETSRWVAALGFSIAAVASAVLVVIARRTTRRLDERYGRDGGRQR